MDGAENIGPMAVIAAVLIGGYFLYQHFTAPAAPTIEQQRICAEQAKKIYDAQWGGVINTDYQSHYDVGKARCFVLVEASTFGVGRMTYSASLSDAFSNEQIGSFFSSVGPQSSENSLFCSIIDGGGKPMACKDESEWHQWTADYLQPLAHAANTKLD